MMPPPLLTGYGYEKDRPIACLEPGCAHRFMRNVDLENHMDTSHQWNIDDIEDAMREREAREGGKFWIGGGEDLEAEEDREFRRLWSKACSLGVNQCQWLVTASAASCSLP